MLERLRSVVLRILRVPAEPTPPAGDPDTIQVFRAAPKYFRYRLLGWGLAQTGALIGLVVGFIGLDIVMGRFDSGILHTLAAVTEVLAWLGFLTQLPLTLAALRLDYEMRWYMLSDRSLRIREGVMTVREKTMTFANIQQIGVRQGPIQRLLDIADIEVRTAGGGASSSEDSGSSHDMHRGYFRGVDRPEAVRDAIRERVRQHRDAGLGDPDEPARLPATATEPALDAAGTLLHEVRLLRSTLLPGGA